MDGTMSSEYDTADYRARAAIDRGIRDVINRQHGDDGFDRATPPPGIRSLVWTERTPKPLLGVRAALMLQDAARHALNRFVADARGAGHSWTAVGTALGLPVEEHRSPGEAAYEYVVPADDGAWQRPSIWWRCRSCDKHVNDHGPYESHPDDCEDGHAPDCGRHRDAIAAYERDSD